MRLHFFTIPVMDPGPATQELNHLLATTRVLAVDRQLIHDGQASAWAVCVSVAPGSGAATESAGTRQSPGLRPGRVDYKAVLPPEQFARFVKLRELRKTLAERDAVPPYAVFNNQQLAEMVTQGVRTQAALAKLSGVGPARVKKYAAPFLALLVELADGASASPEAVDAEA